MRRKWRERKDGEICKARRGENGRMSDRGRDRVREGKEGVE